jgi:hypothetical protein
MYIDEVIEVKYYLQFLILIGIFFYTGSHNCWAEHVNIDLNYPQTYPCINKRGSIQDDFWWFHKCCCHCVGGNPELWQWLRKETGKQTI